MWEKNCIGKNQTVVYHLQMYASLQGCTEIAPELPGKHKKSQLGPSPNTRETKKKKDSQERGGYNRSSDRAQPWWKNDSGEFPLRIFETTALIFPRLPFFSAGDLQPASSLQPYPVIEASCIHLGPVWSQYRDYVTAPSGWKKQQLQSCLVFQFSRKDPHPTKMILKFSPLMGASETMEWLREEKPTIKFE